MTFLKLHYASFCPLMDKSQVTCRKKHCENGLAQLFYMDEFLFILKQTIALISCYKSYITHNCFSY